MQTFMLKLDRWLRRHRGLVIGTWLVLVLARCRSPQNRANTCPAAAMAIPGSRTRSELMAQLPKIAPGAQTRRCLAGCWRPRPARAPARDDTGALHDSTPQQRGAANVSVSPAVRVQTQRAIDAAGTRQRTLVVPLDDER